MAAQSKRVSWRFLYRSRQKNSFSQISTASKNGYELHTFGYLRSGSTGPGLRNINVICFHKFRRPPKTGMNFTLLVICGQVRQAQACAKSM